MSAMTSKNSSRRTHQFEADRTLKVFVQRRMNRRIVFLVRLKQKMTDKVFVDFFVAQLALSLHSFFVVLQDDVVVQVAADVEVPLEVNLAVRILRKDSFFVSELFVNKFCDVRSVQLDRKL